MREKDVQAEDRRTSGYDTASLVLGILAFATMCMIIIVVPQILAILAIVVGHKARRHPESNPKLVKAGIILGWSTLGASFVLMVAIGTLLVLLTS